NSTAPGFISSVGWKAVLFPLTLTLSLREREQQPMPCPSSGRASFADRRATILPLLWGEGRGEGKTDRRRRHHIGTGLHVQPSFARTFPRVSGYTILRLRLGRRSLTLSLHAATFHTLSPVHVRLRPSA